MSRKIDLAGKVAVVPLSLIASADRDVDATDVEVLIVYPDEATAPEIAELVRATLQGGNDHE